MSLRGRSERRPYAKNVTGHHFETGPDADSTGDCFPRRFTSRNDRVSKSDKKFDAGMKLRPSTLFFTRPTVSHNRAFCCENDLAPAP